MKAKKLTSYVSKLHMGKGVQLHCTTGKYKNTAILFHIQNSIYPLEFLHRERTIIMIQSFSKILVSYVQIILLCCV